MLLYFVDVMVNLLALPSGLFYFISQGCEGDAATAMKFLFPEYWWLANIFRESSIKFPVLTCHVIFSNLLTILAPHVSNGAEKSLLEKYTEINKGFVYLPKKEFLAHINAKNFKNLKI